ncbi:hypothetical protein Anapl_15725 [Anas platyrhynchos]|uniref:Uncharacterized protein n=1 Tax=Anas platyrhynchos TaxID=8839 RepID=R0JK83_ANAPL|nr:hypothetical protein Anapl_15725 [Anas platyrhynchos]
MLLWQEATANQEELNDKLLSRKLSSYLKLLLGSSGRLTGSLTLCTHRDFCRSALNRVSPKHLGTGGNQKELLLLLLLAATTTPDVLVLPKRRREGEEEEEEVMVVVVLVVGGFFNPNSSTNILHQSTELTPDCSKVPFGKTSQSATVPFGLGEHEARRRAGTGALRALIRWAWPCCRAPTCSCSSNWWNRQRLLPHSQQSADGWDNALGKHDCN